MISVLSSIAVALVVLGVIIVLHELGHFLVAKLFKIRVETFSVGFGPRILGYKYGDTDYRISAFPLGGYVKMSGENPGDEVTGDIDEFMSKPKWQRFLVAAAGPAMNVILAVVLLAGLYVYGSEVPEHLESEARVGIVAAGSAAEEAGIRPGDLIVEFDGEVNPTWQNVDIKTILSADQPILTRLERSGEIIETTVTPVPLGPRESGYAGMGPHFRVFVAAFTGRDTPAERGGLLPGDEIIQIGDIGLSTSGRTIQELIQSMPSDIIPLTVLRDAETINLEVRPELNDDGQRMIGIQMPMMPTVMIKLGLIDALDRSIRTNAANGMLIFEILGRLIKRETSMRSLDGPIGIVRVSGQAFQLGLAPLISLMALISLNLGILNLLPIPILDGGVMLLLLIEGIMGHDLSLAVKERIVQFSFVFLMVLTVFVLYNDVVKLLPSSQ